ncbi:hypothetical protein K1T71_002741 [Dendrolimus kikuchii]|uniref:Uncharacterized protein n=3 Tax=Dendrolimus kikuchii TaxID=765133 RepID=A0ACC1DE40_9NEOP|nr:hypothetical protein K1T71_011608 [Dendrolimus kikuchii]KAJ0181082.1 hypothetical protein K1T71_003167 [Dendrolimus kikuchii]KAJ0182019.1 hypothetical protein K1T71_002741 [Dendrolimus kikuchii]
MDFGKLMVNAKIGKIAQQGIKNVGRNRVSVEFLTPHDANEFVSNPILADSKYEAMIPTFNVTRMGIARDVPPDWSMEEFVNKIELPQGCGKILKARRFNRKVRHQDGSTEWCPSTTVVLTFSGQFLPNYIYCYFTSLKIEPYILPTIQCYSCCRFGHVGEKCRSKPRCYKCGQAHTGNACTIHVENAYCCLCTGHHYAIDKNCAEHNRQKLIKKKMSEDNVSYSEAATLFPPVLRSYSDVARTMFASPQSPSKTPTRPQVISTTSPQSPSGQSHRRTIYASPKPRSPLAPGYDRAAHQALITQRDPPSPHNGVAFSNHYTNISEDDNLMDILLAALINIYSRFEDVPTPPNVAQKLSLLTSLINKHGSNTME